MNIHAECPSCGWEGSVLPERGKALCPECEWFFHLPEPAVEVHAWPATRR